MTVLVKRNLLLVENIGHLYVKIKRKLAADRSCVLVVYLPIKGWPMPVRQRNLLTTKGSADEPAGQPTTHVKEATAAGILAQRL